MRERLRRKVRRVLTPNLLWAVPVLLAGAAWLAAVYGPLAITAATVLVLAAPVLVVAHVNRHPLRYEHTTELGFCLVMLGGLGLAATVVTAVQSANAGAGAWQSAAVALVLFGSGVLIGTGLLIHERLPLGARRR
jgi:hypothetical protein